MPGILRKAFLLKAASTSVVAAQRCVESGGNRQAGEYVANCPS
jgi:hypothetical protein